MEFIKIQYFSQQLTRTSQCLFGPRSFIKFSLDILITLRQSNLNRLKLSGIEVFYQVGLQIVLILLTLTGTATVGGLEAFFQQGSLNVFGILLSPTTVIVISVLWSLKTGISLHVKLLSMEKGFFGFKAKCITCLWGLVATVRRVLGIVAFFIPCLGLMDLLWHFHGEQYPFSARVEQVMASRVTPSPDEKIELNQMREEVLWADLDR